MQTFTFSKHVRESRRDHITVSLRRAGFAAYRDGESDLVTNAGRLAVLITAGHGLALGMTANPDTFAKAEDRE